MANPDQWLREHFATYDRSYDDPKLDDERLQVRVVVQVNGKTELDISTQHHVFEPGVIAFVSHPDKRALSVIKVVPAPNGAISDQGPLPPAPEWAAQLLDLKG